MRDKLIVKLILKKTEEKIGIFKKSDYFLMG